MMTAIDGSGIVHLWLKDTTYCGTRWALTQADIPEYPTCILCVAHVANLEQLIHEMQETMKTLPYLGQVKI